jgi:hypothetical protein
VFFPNTELDIVRAPAESAVRLKNLRLLCDIIDYLYNLKVLLF